MKKLGSKGEEGVRRGGGEGGRGGEEEEKEEEGRTAVEK